MLHRALILAIKEFELLRNDATGMALSMLVPTMVVAIWITTVKIRSTGIPAAVCHTDPASSREARRIVEWLRSSGRFGEIHELEHHRDLDALLRRNTVSLGIIILPGQDSDGQSKTIVLEGDGLSPGPVMYELGQIERLLGDTLDVRRKGDGGGEPFPVNIRIRFNPDALPVYFLLPGLAVLVSNWVAAVWAALSVGRERSGSLLVYLKSLPLRNLEVVLGKTAVPLFLGLLNLVLIICVCSLVFHIRLGSVWGFLQLAAASTVPILASTWLGVFLGWITRTPIGNVMSLSILLLCTFFLSGWWTPVYELPSTLRFVSWTLAATHHIPMAKSLLFRGASLAEVAPFLSASAALGVLAFLAAWWAARRASAED